MLTHAAEVLTEKQTMKISPFDFPSPFDADVAVIRAAGAAAAFGYCRVLNDTDVKVGGV